MIIDSIENRPYVRRMIATLGEPDLPVPVPESLHEQTDEELTETDIKRMDADDQAIQTILLGLPEDVYAAENKAKLFNEWEKFTSTDGESIKSYYHRFMQLMNDLKRNKHFPKNIASNLKFLNNLQPEWKRHVTIVRQTKNLHEADFTQIYDFLKMNQEEVSELRAKRLAKSHDPLALMAHSQNSFNFPTTHKDQSSSRTHPQQSFPINKKYNPQPPLNQNFMQPPMTSLEYITDLTEAMNAARILFAKAFQLFAPTNNNQRTSSNPRNRQIAQPVMNMGQDRRIQNVGGNGGNQFGQYDGQVAQNHDGNQNGLVVIPGIANQSGTGNVVATRAEGTGIGNQASLYNGNLLLKEHEPPTVYDSEETLELAQESREKIRLLKKEIKLANYAKINHLSWVFVPQTTKFKKELFLSNVSNMVTASKTISIPNEDLSDDTTPSVARKFLNEVKSSLVTLQRVAKQKMTLEVQNWSSSAHKEVHKIISHEITPIINQVDARVQNFKIRFLQEAAKFVRDFKSLAKEADESLDKQKFLELEIERLLKASVSHDIMSIVQISLVDVPSDLRTELDPQLRDLKGKHSDTPSASNTLGPLNQKLESKIIELEFQVVNYEREISHLKTTYKNLFDSIKSNREHAKLHDLTYENAQLRAWGFENTSESVKNTSGTSVTPRVDKPKLIAVTPHSKKLHASTQLVPNKQSSASIRTNPITNSQRHITVKENVNSDTATASSTGLVHTARTRKPQPKGKTRNARIPSASKSSEVKKVVTVEDHCRTLLLFKNRKTMSSECNNIKLAIRNDKSKIVCDTCKQCLVTANHDACLTPSVNVLDSRANKLCANVPRSANQKRHRTQVWKPKQVGSKERLAPKPRLPRFSFKWSPSGRNFDLKGKLVASKKTNCSNDDKACTTNPQEPMRKRFPNSTLFLGRLSKFVQST
nr:hypothetical protein [Tanacetum cinerariifolium]